MSRLLPIRPDGNVETGLPPSSEAVSESLGKLELSWIDFRDSVDMLLEGSDTIGVAADVGQLINEVMPKLQAKEEEVIRALISQKASRTTINLATRQSVLSQRIVNSVNSALKVKMLSSQLNDSLRM